MKTCVLAREGTRPWVGGFSYKVEVVALDYDGEAPTLPFGSQRDPIPVQHIYHPAILVKCHSPSAPDITISRSAGLNVGEGDFGTGLVPGYSACPGSLNV